MQIENNPQTPERVAILIDAENVPAGLAEPVFEKAAALGTIAAKEMYGSGTALSNWTEPALRYAIHPNCTLRQTKGKNTSDIALTIGAMDLVIAGNAGVIVIVSSDSDFSALAIRLRNAGLHVVGMGEEKSNELWKLACSEFITLEPRTKKEAKPARQRPVAAEAKPAAHQRPAAEEQKPIAAETRPAAPAVTAASAPAEELPAKQEEKTPLPDFEGLAAIIEDIILKERDAEGWLLLTNIAQSLHARMHGFSTRHYGYSTMSGLVADMPRLEMKRVRHPSKRGLSIVAVRIRSEEAIAADTQEHRLSVIRQRLQDMLTKRGGSMLISRLCNELKRCPEYIKERDHAGKKPVDFFTAFFADLIHMENRDNAICICLNEAPQTAPAADTVQVAPAAEEAPAEALPAIGVEVTDVPEETVKAEVTNEPDIVEAPEVMDGQEATDAPEAAAEPAPEMNAAPEDAPASITAMDKLIALDVPAEDAAVIYEMMDAHETMFKLYNALRTRFGMTKGTAYYKLVKQIMEE